MNEMTFLQKTNSLRKNIVSNFVGQGWSFYWYGSCTFLYPIYRSSRIRFSWFLWNLASYTKFILRLWLDAKINREIARYSASPTRIGQTRDLVRTFEIAYWLIGLVLGLTIYLSAPLISMYWLLWKLSRPTLLKK